MREVLVSGVGMTSFGKFPEASLKSLGEEAVRDALQDAGVQTKQVGAAFFSNAIAGLITGQEMVRGQVVLRRLGFHGIPIINVENACAGGATAVHLAYQAVASGQTDVALAVGAEKMSHEDPRRAIEAIATAMDVDEPIDTSAKSPFMEHYAKRVRSYMEKSGATAADFAEVAVKAQRNGARNPFAQYGDEHCKLEDILASTLVVDPLTVKMCSPIGDGASAVVVTAADRPSTSDGPSVYVRASVLRSGTDEGTAIADTARFAYEKAGIGPSDLDVVELHDANAASEIMRYEALGFAAPDEGPELVRREATVLGGPLPVNPSGGLIARGHPIGASGCAQIYELVMQLRGQAGRRQVPGARVALAENGGGWVREDVAAEAVHILTT